MPFLMYSIVSCKSLFLHKKDSQNINFEWEGISIQVIQTKSSVDKTTINIAVFNNSDHDIYFLEEKITSVFCNGNSVNNIIEIGEENGSLEKEIRLRGLASLESISFQSDVCDDFGKIKLFLFYIPNLTVLGEDYTKVYNNYIQVSNVIYNAKKTGLNLGYLTNYKKW